MNRNIGSTDSVDTNQKQQRRPLAVPRSPYPGRSARRSGVSQKDKIESKFSFDTADAVRDKFVRIRSYAKSTRKSFRFRFYEKQPGVASHGTGISAWPPTSGVHQHARPQPDHSPLRTRMPLTFNFEFSTSSVDHFQRKLNLPRRARGLADDPKPAAAHNVGRQPKIHDIKHVEKLRAKLQRPELAVSPPSKRRVLDQSHIEIVQSRSAKRIAPQCPEAPLVWSGATGHVDGNQK